MKNSSIKSIEIERLYGKKSFIVDLDNQPLRILHGQNGIGKTSLLRAVDAILSEDIKTLEGLGCSGVEVVTNLGSVRWAKNEGVTWEINEAEEPTEEFRTWLVDLGSSTELFKKLIKLTDLNEFQWTNKISRKELSIIDRLAKSSNNQSYLTQARTGIKSIKGPCIRISELELRKLVKTALSVATGKVKHDLSEPETPLFVSGRLDVESLSPRERKNVYLYKLALELKGVEITPRQDLVDLFQTLVPDPSSFIQVRGNDPVTFSRYVKENRQMSAQDYIGDRSPCILISTNRLRGELSFRNGELLEWHDDDAELRVSREQSRPRRFLLPGISQVERTDSAAQTNYCVDQCIEAFDSHIKDLSTKAREKAASLESTYIKRLTQKDTHEQLDQELIEQVKELHRDLSRVGIVDQTDLEFDGLHDIREHKVAIRQWIEDLRNQYESIDRKDVKKLTLFIEVLQKYLSGKEVSIDSQQRNLRITEYSDDGLRSDLKPKHLSSGEQHIIVICFSYIFKPEHASICMIDEPELSLNNSWQRDLIDTLISIDRRLDRDTQLILATHSPQIVSEHIDELIEISPTRDSLTDSYQSDR